MSKRISIKNSDYQFQDYFNSCNISENTQRKIENDGLLILPTRYEENKYHFMAETIHFYKHCKYGVGKPIELLADDDRIKTIYLESFDIWMPIIFVSQNILLPVAVNLVSSYIYDKLRGREHEKSNVKITFIVKDGEKTKELTYDGDAQDFKKAFEEFDESL